jgi:hypothetical protein
VAACVATELGRRRGWAAGALLVAALVDAFVGQRLPFRQRATVAETPSAYRADTGPVLDLWPGPADSLPAWDLRTTNDGCMAQVGHGRPIADLCVGHGAENPRIRIGTELTDALLREDLPAAYALLHANGFTTVALHPDVFRTSDRQRVTASLARLDSSPVASTDGGDHVVAYRVPTTAPAFAAPATPHTPPPLTASVPSPTPETP